MQSSHFEGANPPTAVFLVMTHKIPHNSDTIFLIKSAAKMKLYIWCLKKKKGGGEDKTLLVVIRSEAVEHKTNSMQCENKADGCTQMLCRKHGFEREGSAACHQGFAVLYVATYTDVRIISCTWTAKGAFISRMT